MKIGVWHNKHKQIELAKFQELYRYIEERNQTYLDVDDSTCDEVIMQLDCVIAIGGDGTLISVARKLARLDIPILGINMGRRGFLSSAEMEELPLVVDSLVDGNFTMDERLMIMAEINLDGKPKKLVAMNEFGIFNSNRARMLSISIDIGGNQVESYYADGLLISSPTGSTAYSLSAGGPLMHPSMDGMLITPICAHSLNKRPIVIPSDFTVTVKHQMEDDSAVIVSDGQETYELKSADEVKIGKSEHNVKFIRIKEDNFFNILKEKLNAWGKFE